MEKIDLTKWYTWEATGTSGCGHYICTGDGNVKFLKIATRPVYMYGPGSFFVDTTNIDGVEYQIRIDWERDEKFLFSPSCSYEAEYHEKRIIQSDFWGAVGDILDDVPETLSGTNMAALIEKLERIRGFDIPGEVGTACVISWREING